MPIAATASGSVSGVPAPTPPAKHGVLGIPVDGRAFRALILLFNCMLTFGTYYCFDLPASLKDRFQQGHGEPYTDRFVCWGRPSSWTTARMALHSTRSVSSHTRMETGEAIESASASRLHHSSLAHAHVHVHTHA